MAPWKVVAWRRSLKVMTEAAVEVGPALFFSLMIITLSFIPVFTLQAQEEGCLRPRIHQDLCNGSSSGPFGYPGTRADGVLDSGSFTGRRAQPTQSNPDTALSPSIEIVLRRPKLTLAGALLILLSSVWP